MTTQSEASDLLALLPRLAGKRVLVVGDVFLDEYVAGRATRLSREAPIPVLEFEERRTLPGGGANPAMNVVALGGAAIQVGVIGDDEAGRTLVAQLEQAGIDAAGLVTDPARATTTKTRIISRGSLVFPQQLARIDRVDRAPLPPDVEMEVVMRIAACAPHADALLVSDYQTGLITNGVVQALKTAAQRHHLLRTADAQGELLKYRGFDLVKCNRHEANAMVGRILQNDVDYADAAVQLLADLDLGAMLITRGPDGLTLAHQGGALHLPAANRSEVFDVTGAGDTAIAVATLALAAGADLPAAAALANYAAGLVVRRLGNATPTVEELEWAINEWS
jgi:rfaE bifunctional protein kinase chain/domain